jgi:hypothetical protein
MAPKIGNKDSKAKAVKNAVTNPKDSCKVANNSRGAATSPHYTEEAPIKGSVQRKR